MDGQVEEVPCTQCDEAKRLAAEVRAEIAAEPVKCARCPQAVEWVRNMVKAGRVKPAEAFAYLDTFSESDATFDEIKAEVEARPLIAPAKAQVFIAGGQQVANTDDVIDETHMNRQRRLAGLPTK